MLFRHGEWWWRAADRAGVRDNLCANIMTAAEKQTIEWSGDGLHQQYQYQQKLIAHLPHCCTCSLICLLTLRWLDYLRMTKMISNAMCFCTKRLLILIKPTGYSHFRGLKRIINAWDTTPPADTFACCAHNKAHFYKPHYSTVLSVPEKGIGLPISSPISHHQRINLPGRTTGCVCVCVCVCVCEGK